MLCYNCYVNRNAIENRNIVGKGGGQTAENRMKDKKTFGVHGRNKNRRKTGKYTDEYIEDLYENDLYKGLQENTTFKTERICINDIKGFVSKLFSPLRNLRLINRLDIYDLIIFNSVEGYYPFLLG